ncbi:pyridoxamine 5'-phosphate oxidase family protein [uncultured Roseobacter sp.]|uniref:pyridoxamine 5'-phosphate oxidase family protein n=1 Tax=uncultured Roseobacter sp. TaxID=114847 RepID=UPI00262FD9D9|nr:pyridoxamine 5'-phosphate oxidase family protein [uncultured Roseobacter sp.]
MNDLPQDTPAKDPFHVGEQALQTRAGKRDRMREIGRRVIRPFMPDQHREFFGQLPFVVLGSVDADGWPWASIIAGQIGFLSSPDPKQLDVNAMPLVDDPLGKALSVGTPIGLLGIEMSTRRRNRMNARVTRTGTGGFSLGVDQSFGNCPKYIQTREIAYVRDPGAKGAHPATRSFEHLDHAAQSAIENADAFFVASSAQPAEDSIADGVDVSHRGGEAGFIRVDGDTLTIPDYVGNFFFNTLGNFLLTPKAGLIFPDFETGDVLMLTGTVDLLWEDDPRVRTLQNAERAWRFKLDHGLRIPDALPFRSRSTRDI